MQGLQQLEDLQGPRKDANTRWPGPWGWKEEVGRASKTVTLRSLDWMGQGLRGAMGNKITYLK